MNTEAYDKGDKSVNVIPKQPIFTERVAEVIDKNLEQGWGSQGGYAKSHSDQAAAEIIKLLEAEDKTLTLLAADLDIPLWKAMRCANYGKQQYKELLLAELPDKRVPNGYDSYDEIKAWNEYDREIRRRLTE